MSKSSNARLADKFLNACIAEEESKRGKLDLPHVIIIRQPACFSVVTYNPDGLIFIHCQSSQDYCEGFASAWSNALKVLHYGTIGLERGNSAEVYRQYLADKGIRAVY